MLCWMLFIHLSIPYVLRKFTALNIFIAEISCLVSETSSNVLSAIPKYFLSGLLGDETTALYPINSVKHILLSGHLTLFLQMHSWLLEFG